MTSSTDGMTTTRLLHVRRADKDLDGLVDHLLELLEAEAATIDVSQHDARGDVVQVQTASRRDAS